MSWNLIKLDESVGTQVRLIVIKIHKNQLSDDVIMTLLGARIVISQGS